MPLHRRIDGPPCSCRRKIFRRVANAGSGSPDGVAAVAVAAAVAVLAAVGRAVATTAGAVEADGALGRAEATPPEVVSAGAPLPSDCDDGEHLARAIAKRRTT